MSPRWKGWQRWRAAQQDDEVLQVAKGGRGQRKGGLSGSEGHGAARALATYRELAIDSMFVEIKQIFFSIFFNNFVTVVSLVSPL